MVSPELLSFVLLVLVLSAAAAFQPPQKDPIFRTSACFYFPRPSRDANSEESPDQPRRYDTDSNYEDSLNQPRNYITGMGLDRRRFATLILPSLLITTNGGKSWAADANTPFINFKSQLQAESTELDVGLLESRVTENVLSPPSYGMESADIVYPSWFKGSWKVSSKTVDVQAPCGVALFGGNSTYERARDEIGTSLTYECRFVPDGTGNVIADREFNVREIAKAAMGQYSVYDIPLATPNKLSCVLAPKGSPTMLRVDLIALNRRQETLSDLKFDCSEVTREIVAPVNSNGAAQATATPTATVLKEVETTSLYTFDPSKNEVHCQQRSATFLLPSQSSPIAYKMWEAARGRPIDTRFYDVRYTKSG